MTCNLGHSYLRDEGVEAICWNIKKFTNLLYLKLDLSGNKLFSDSGEDLAVCLRSF